MRPVLAAAAIAFLHTVMQNVVAVPVSSAAAHEAAYHGVPLTTLEDAEQVMAALPESCCDLLQAASVHRHDASPAAIAAGIQLLCST